MTPWCTIVHDAHILLQFIRPLSIQQSVMAERCRNNNDESNQIAPLRRRPPGRSAGRFDLTRKWGIIFWGGGYITQRRESVIHYPVFPRTFSSSDSSIRVNLAYPKFILDSVLLFARRPPSCVGLILRKAVVRGDLIWWGMFGMSFVHVSLYIESFCCAYESICF